MKDYKTVKEVCALTGLTGKHLYYFHHENVVRAAAYANYSVEGNDGYKLYDSAGVKKLQQIALYYQLGLKRNEIRDLMLSPDYDGEAAIGKLLVRKIAEQERLGRQISALEYLKDIGLENGLTDVLRGCSLEELVLMEKGQTQGPPDRDPRFREFRAKLGALLTGPEAETGQDRLVEGIAALGEQFFGTNGGAFALGLLASGIGGPETAAVQKAVSPELGKRIWRYILDRSEDRQPHGNALLGV